MIIADNNINTEDSKLYKELTESGKFYEFMAEKMNINIINEDTRSNFKKRLFGTLFFDKNHSYETKEEITFKQYFPNLYQLIKEEKKVDYTDLANKLQKYESNFIIKHCINIIRQDKPDIFIATIHDSIVSHPENLDYIKEIMQGVMSNIFDLKPTFKITKFN
jgi:hypothetical protein